MQRGHQYTHSHACHSLKEAELTQWTNILSLYYTYQPHHHCGVPLHHVLETDCHALRVLETDCSGQWVKCTVVRLGIGVVHCTVVRLGIGVVHCTVVRLGIGVVHCTVVRLGIGVVHCTVVQLGIGGQERGLICLGVQREPPTDCYEF